MHTLLSLSDLSATLHIILMNKENLELNPEINVSHPHFPFSMEDMDAASENLVTEPKT